MSHHGWKEKGRPSTGGQRTFRKEGGLLDQFPCYPRLEGPDGTTFGCQPMTDGPDHPINFETQKRGWSGRSAIQASSAGLGSPYRERAVEGTGHRPALDLFDVPVVGQAGPSQDRLDGGRPHVARLHRLDAPQREHVGEVDEPELVLVDLQPRMRVLAAHVVHGFAEVLDHAGQLALPSRNESPRATEAVTSLRQPALRGAPAPRADHV